MARVPYLDRADLDEPYQHLLDRPINLVRALAHSPDGLARFQGTGEWMLQRSSVDQRLRELAIMRVGYTTGSEYEYSHHLRISESCGVSDEDRAAVSDPDGRALEPAARLVLTAADEITWNLRLKDRTWRSLTAELGVRAAVELVLIVAHYNAVVRVLGALNIDVEPDYASYLDRYPLGDA
jgi:alkylhydroperoxidase family enzyme